MTLFTNNNLRARFRTLTDEKIQSDTEYAMVEQTRDNLEHLVKGLMEERKQSDAEYAKLEKTQNQLMKKCVKLEEDNQQWYIRLDNSWIRLDNEQPSSRGYCERANSNDILKATVKSLQEEKSALEHKLDKLSERNKGLEHKLARLSSSAKDLQDDRDGLEKDCNELIKELMHLSQSCIGREEQVPSGFKPKATAPEQSCPKTSNRVRANSSASEPAELSAFLMRAMVGTNSTSESNINTSSIVQKQATQPCGMDNASNCSQCNTHDGNYHEDFSNRKFVTIYVGNLSYKASSGDVKNMFQSRLKINIDSAIIARSSEGISRGCAFVTFRGGDYSQFKQRFKALKVKSILGRKVYVEVAKSQRRES